MTHGDRLAVLNEGEGQQRGTPLEVYHAPVNISVARFLGSPAINLISGTVRQEHGSVALVGDGVALPLSPRLAPLATAAGDGAVTLGVRSEDVTVATSAGKGAPARIDVAGPMGSLNVVYASAGATRVAAATAPDIFPGAGSPVWIAPRPDKSHLFATGTGLALGA